MLFLVHPNQRIATSSLSDDHEIKNVQVFGSVARLEYKPTRDLDLIVEFEKGRSLLDMIRFKQEVEDLLNIKVDVVTENLIHWSIKKDVVNGAIQF